MYVIHTDLAEELRDHAISQKAKEKAGELDGVLYQEETKENIRISTMQILSKDGETLMGKPKGTYITLSFPTAANMGYAELLSLADTLCEKLLAFFGGKKRILVAGLGNERFSADALGPIAVRHTLVTHHLKEMDMDFMKEFADIAAITPGILSKTGMESADMIKSAIETVHPDGIIAIDALAAREADRLARTIQLCDTGISPGSGLGNHRKALNAETLGIPVLAIGVPTVVDTATLVYDALNGDIREATLEKLRGLFVSPKEIDDIAENLGRVIGYAVNRAFHGSFPYEEMAMMA